MAVDDKASQMFLERLHELADAAKNDSPPELLPTILETSARGDEVTIIYKQAPSTQIFGRRGSLREFASLFSPEPSVDSLAAIVLRSMVEPHADPGASSDSAGGDNTRAHIAWYGL